MFVKRWNKIDFNLLFRWFVGLELDDEVWDATVFCHNRDRLLTHDVAEMFFEQIKAQADAGAQDGSRLPRRAVQ